jgi:hypothetical protein
MAARCSFLRLQQGAVQQRLPSRSTAMTILRASTLCH